MAARRAHNPKVPGSSPGPATSERTRKRPRSGGRFLLFAKGLPTAGFSDEHGRLFALDGPWQGGPPTVICWAIDRLTRQGVSEALWLVAVRARAADARCGKAALLDVVWCKSPRIL